MRKAFTLLETVFATAVVSAVIVAAMGSWLLFMNKTNRANTQASLDLDARKVVERFRAEMRNAARETIIFYPERQAPYKAVGFALASDSDGDGLMDMDATGSNILWRQTVVYHVYERKPTQMRRTVFSNRNAGASYSDYYGQVGKVAVYGNGANACLPGEATQTYVLFENLFTGKLWHAESTFDGYDPASNTLDRTTFGSMSLAPGAHTVAFTVADKHPSSTGKRIRVDQISAGVSGWPLEAELCSASGISSAPMFVGVGLAGAAYARAAATAANGDAVSMTVYNDAIEECGFIGKGRNVAFSNTVVRFDETLTPAGFPQGVYATKLDGQFKTAWWASEQAFNQSSGGRDPTSTDTLYMPTNCVIRVPVRGAFVRESGYGPVFRMYRSAYNYNLQVLNPAYAPTDTVTSPDIVDTNTLTRLEFYQNGVKKANWAACAAGGLELRPAKGQLVPLSAGKDYLFSFQVTVQTVNTDGIRAFRMDNSAGWACWVIKGGNAATAMQGVWSTVPGLDYVSKRESGMSRLCLPGLVNMAVNFADGGDYVSHPFDTRTSAGKEKTFAWDADVPTGATLVMYARSGNTLAADGFGIADAPEWASVGAVANGGVVPSGSGRYMQFRAVFQSAPFSVFPEATGGTVAGPYCKATPRLRHVLIKWAGEEKYVDIVANLLKGPDCGIFKVEVDGKPLVRGVTMEIEIYKDILTQGGMRTERLRSAMMAEIEPRNSQKK
ncbi:MAG: hypothetical protein WCK89_17115 [bacterium]